MPLVAPIMVIQSLVSVGEIAILETTMLVHYVEKNVKVILQMRYGEFAGAAVARV
jgi:hypothetical protein